MDVELTEDGRWLRFAIADDHYHLIPVSGVRVWRVLLGCADDVEAVAAMLAARDDESSYTADRNAWTPAWEQLSADLLEDYNRDSMVETVKPLSADGRRLVADGRNATRIALGLPAADISQLSLLSEYGDAPDATIPLPDGVDAGMVQNLLDRCSGLLESSEAGFREGLVEGFRDSTG